MIGMQKKGWMDTFYFMEWMDYFIHKIEANEGLFQSRRHLLILDDYTSHTSLEVLLKAKECNINMISIPSHASRGLQPLDYAYFRPSQVTFRAYKNLWNLKKHRSRCEKE